MSWNNLKFVENTYAYIFEVEERGKYASRVDH